MVFAERVNTIKSIILRIIAIRSPYVVLVKRFWAVSNLEVPIGSPDHLTNHITTMPIS
jgi:hypothetical protein